ncbi:glycerophosphoryl diester phosphodiesterase [Friedmanniella endophytica]|uniref:Glycerophosphoryl diester phosphodiesterase n=1 Tax=Microlunatus kandeliicorticis TaxID=1759536 RepID=A0A7W3IW31_9ACTN|nr:glycerophosphodiester phosphodiesterase family protein [Microlunatus kandeliicorticis]MBA8796195.1 glycerophosphoryl diester phosphodiesterase [Microlunatus kandeliicorticis]
MPARISRRSLVIGGLSGGLGVGLATAGLGGCASSGPPSAQRLLAGDPFYVAHRGGDRDWPQMTAYAYDQAVRLPGLRALEVSVCLSRDGVLVCCHDADTLAATGVRRVIAETDWAELRTLTVSAAGTLDPEQPRRPLSRIEDVLPHLDRFVVFAEPKVGPAREPLMRVLARAGRPGQVVWKQPVDSTAFAAARRAGFRTWGYVLDQPSHLGANLSRFAASDDLDALGAPLAESDAFIAAVVAAAHAHGKPTVAWPATDTADRDRALRLGCRGIMAADIRGLVGTTAGQPAHAS